MREMEKVVITGVSQRASIRLFLNSKNGEALKPN